MTVKIQGTGKSKELPVTYFTELDREQADNLVKKGYVKIVDEIPVEVKEEPVKEVKPITLNSIKAENAVNVPVIVAEDEKAKLIAAKEKEFKEAKSKEDKRRLKKELDELKK